MAGEFDLSKLSIDRRSFLRRGAVGGAGAVLLAGGGMSAFLAACSSSSKPASSSTTPTSAAGGAPDFGELSYQLSWIKNVEFGGSFIADTNGYFKQLGFSSVKFLAGGSGPTADSVVDAGNALVGISAPDITSPAILQGADVITIGAQYQKNPFAIMSLASKPIKTPQDMIGKKIGVQDANAAVWTAFLKANNIAPSKVDKVVVQFDPSPLVAGTVDGWFSFFTNEPNLLKIQKVDTYVFKLADFKYPLVSETYVVKKSNLQSKRAEIKAMLKGDIMGWHQNLKDPALGATLAATKYGKDQHLTVEEQTLESKSENTLILTPDTQANGLFTITPKLIDENIATLKFAGITITKEQLFDTSIIDEVYQENPDLKTIPA